MDQSPLFRWKKMLHFICKSGSQSLEEEWRDTESMFLKSSVKFPQSVMIWAAVSSAGVGPLCFLKSEVNAAIYQHFMLSSADKLYGDADFIFQQDLAPAHTAKGTKSWLNTMVLLYMHELWWSVHLWITEHLASLIIYWLDWLFLPPLWPQSSLHDTGVILLVSPTRVTLSMTSICSVPPRLQLLLSRLRTPDWVSWCLVAVLCAICVRSDSNILSLSSIICSSFSPGFNVLLLRCWKKPCQTAFTHAML